MPEEENDEIPIILQSLRENQDGGTQLRITDRNGLLLFDCSFQGIPQQPLDTVRKALVLSRPTRNITARSTYSLKKLAGPTIDTSNTSFNVCVRIRVPNAKSLLDGSGLPRRGGFFDLFSQKGKSQARKAWSPRDFYDNVYVPVLDKSDKYRLPVSQKLQCTLYPFQERAVRWLLEREGVETGMERRDSTSLPHGFTQTVDCDGRPCFTSSLLRLMTTHEELTLSADTSIRGGILSEVSTLLNSRSGDF